MNHRILSFLLIMLAGMFLAMRVWAIDPLNQPFPETRAKPTMALTRSSVADQLILEPLPQSLKEEQRGLFWIGSQLAYRERGTGRVVLSRSGEDAGPILNPDRPYYSSEEIVYEYLIGCLVSRERLDGGRQWVRALTHSRPSGPDYHERCQVLVEGGRSSWVRTPDAIHRLGLDGQDLVDVPVAALALDIVLAANVDPITDDLILVYRKQVTNQPAMARITTSGQWVPIDLPAQLADVIYPEVLVNLLGPWSLLTKRADGSQWLTQWSEDFGQQVSNPLRVPILRDGSRDEVLDVLSIGAGQTLVLVRMDSGDFTQRSFTLFGISGANDIEQVAIGAAGEHPDRLFPITPSQGIARTVVMTTRRPGDLATITLRTFLGAQLAGQGSITTFVGHQLTAIGDSGEFLLAENEGISTPVNVTLIDHTAHVLERGVMAAQPEPQSWFFGALPDGHMRVAAQSTETASRVYLSRHDREGRTLWSTPWPTVGADHMTVDDNRVCANERFGPVSCFRLSDGLFLGREPETFEPDCRALHGIPRLVDGLLFRGQCLLTSVPSPPSQLARVVMLAPAHLRYPNGDVLWSNGLGVRKLSAQGQLLSGFADDGGNWDALTLRGDRGRPVPLRILEDGGYVFAREETSAGVSGVAIRRIRANGEVAWRHFEPLGSFERPGSFDFPATNVISALDTESMEVFTDRVMLQIYLNLPPVRPRPGPPPFSTQPGRPIELLLDVGNGGLIRRDGMDVEWVWHRKIPHRGGILEVQDERVRMLDLDGNEQFQFRYKTAPPRDNTVTSGYVAIEDGLLRIQDHSYALPEVFPRYRLDQETLDGPWAVQVLGVEVSDNTLNGQGLVLDYLPRDRLLFGAWFLYSPDAYWRESDLHWLTLSGVIPENAARATLGIYETAAGQFNQGMASAPRQVGQATLELDSCATGVLRVTVTEGLYQGVDEEYVIQQVAPWQADCATTSAPAAAVPFRSGFGFNTRQSGGYYEPGKDGQGLTLQVRPDIGSQGTFFATWFTFDPAGASNDPAAHHWLTLQGDLASAVDGRIRARIVRTNGGEPLEKEYSRDFFNYRPAPAFDVVVGDAWVSFTGCDRAEVQYQFDETDLAGSFAGREGSTELIGYGVCAP